MSILDINKRIRKTIIVYFFISIFTIIFDRVYSMFSHGVNSSYMYLMFLYPLIGGTVSYLIFDILVSNFNYKKFRLYFNIYNSGIAVLTVGSLLHGIMEIAGTSSPYLIYYTIVGWLAVGFGVVNIFIKVLIK